MENVLQAVSTGFISWGKLAISLASLFIVLIVLSKITAGKKDKKDDK